MANAKQFKASIVLGGSVAGSLKTAFGNVESGVKRIGSEVSALTKKQKMLGDSIQMLGKQGKNIDKWRERYSLVTKEVDKLRIAQTRMIATQARFNALGAASGKMRGAAMGVGIAAAVIGAPLMAGLNEAKTYAAEQQKIQALGLGDKASEDAVKFATGMKTVGTSVVENMELMRDAVTIFGSVDEAKLAAPTLAKMKFSNAAIFGKEHGAENDQKFYDMLKAVDARGGAKSQEEFHTQANDIQRVLSATGGRVGPEEWRNLIAKGGLAAKGMRDDAFYNQLEYMVQETSGAAVGTGLSAAYSNLYQGKGTTRSLRNLDKLGLIADKKKIQYDKSGQLAHINPGALKGSEIFRQSQFEWVKTILIPTLAKHGMTSKDQIEDAIGGIVSNKRGADWLASLYQQSAQIDRSEKLNKGAAGIDQLNKQALGSTGGKELIAEQKLADLKLSFGRDILPVYTKGLELATVALESLNGFIERNPKFTALMSQGLSILAVGLGILAPVLLTVSYVLVPMARGIQAVTTAVRWLGAAISANPIILFGAALALVAVEVYRHWDGVKAFFVQLWADLTSIFSGAIEVLKGVATLNIGMITDGAKKMFEGMGHFVEHVFDGIGKGISTMVDDALDALGLLDKKQTDYAAKQLANTPQAKKDAAAAYLKTKGVDPDAGVMDTFFGTTPKPAAAPAPGALKWNTGAATDARPGSPASSAAAGGGAPVIQQSNVFHINQLPGEDGDALAHRTAGYLQQQNGVQQRGQLIDGL